MANSLDLGQGGVGPLPAWRIHDLGVAGNDPGVEGVGLGQIAGGVGKTPHAPGIYHRHLEAGVIQGQSQFLLLTAGRLHADQGHRQGGELLEQLPYPGRGVGKSQGFSTGADGDIEPVLAYVDADMRGVVHAKTPLVTRSRHPFSRIRARRRERSRPRTTVRVQGLRGRGCGDPCLVTVSLSRT